MVRKIGGIKILLVGESVFKIHKHFKGFAAYETASITSSLDKFTGRFTTTDINVSFMPNHEVSTKFPFTMAELSQWDVIVFSDAPADNFLLSEETLSGKKVINRLELLCEWVKGGGGFLMVGGWMSFGGFHGKGHWAYSPLSSIIPATIEPHDDRMEVPEGKVPLTSFDHPIIDKLPNKWPEFLGYNRLREPTGDVLLTFPSGDPLLVVEKCDLGRVAVFTSDLMPHWASKNFLEWKGYVPFWKQLFRWLARKI